jgi:PKD repeat protein
MRREIIETIKLFILSMITVLWAIVGSLPSSAQISEGGMPPSFAYSNLSLRSSSKTYEAVIDFDVNQLLADAAEEEAEGVPPSCAKIIPVSLNIENNGNRTTLPDGQIIRTLEIYAPKALAILLYYDKFVLPEGSKLFIYNPDHSRIIGAYTHKTNSKKAAFATEFVNGDRIILEYVAPFSPQGEMILPQIEISGIAYGYNHLQVPAENDRWRSRWDSDPCMINVNCREGDGWKNQKKGVVRVVTPTTGNKVLLCSGTLINNTSGDFDPLLLSAFHCFDGVSASSMNQTIYYFNYEYPGCDNLRTDPSCPTMTGAQMLVALDIDGESDGALLRLNDSIPGHYDVYFNGWDRKNTPPQRGVGIHHPGGDVKKISTFTSPASSVTWRGDEMGASGAHWSVIFSETENGWSVTQGGSSGSPLFNENKLITGTLTGGASSCEIPYGSNIYGKLSYHWNLGLQRMSKYLDPDNSGLESLEGVYADYTVPRANFRTNEKEIYASRKIEFINTSVNGNTWKWIFEGGNPGASNEKNPPLVAFKAPGAHRVSLTINEGTPAEATFFQMLDVVVKDGGCPEEITQGDITEVNTSSFPLGARYKQTLSSSIYTAKEIGLTTGGKIKQIAWHAGKANAEARNLYVYLKETKDSVFSSSDNWAKEFEGATPVYEGLNTWESGWVTITLPEEYRYHGTQNLKVIVRAIASGNENVDSQCSYSTVRNKHLQSESSSIGIPQGNRNGYRPVIRFHAERFCGVKLPQADFNITTSGPGEVDKLLTGDTVRLTDFSTGPVVNWEWLFPDGTPERSTEEHPAVVYKQAGNYPITLNVSNHLGSSSVQKTVKINATASSNRQLVNAKETAGRAVKLYPNPTGTYLNISSQYPIKKITVGNIQGRLISELNGEGKEQTIQTSAWEKGVYLVKIQMETGSFIYKVIKE